MSMDVCEGQVRVIARKKNFKDLQRQEVKVLRDTINKMTDDEVIEHLDNVVKITKNRLDKDEWINDIECSEYYGEKDGWTALHILQKNHTIKIIDENIGEGNNTPYITKAGEEDSFHLSCDSYGAFDYLLSLAKFNEVRKQLEDCGCIYDTKDLTNEIVLNYYKERIKNYEEDVTKLINNIKEQAEKDICYKEELLETEAAHNKCKEHYTQLIKGLENNEYDIFVEFKGCVC